MDYEGLCAVCLCVKELAEKRRRELVEKQKKMSEMAEKRAEMMQRRRDQQKR